MLKMFIKYCLLLNFICVCPINDVEAMKPEGPDCKPNPPRFYHRGQMLEHQQAKERAVKLKQEEEARQKEKQRRELIQKKYEEKQKVKDSIKTAEQLLAEGQDTALEKHMDVLEEAIRGTPVSKQEINAIWTDAHFLLNEENNPDNNARGVLLSLALARYYGAAQGNIDSTIEYLKLAAKYDPDTTKFYEILMGIRQKKDQESKEAGQRRVVEITTGIQAGMQEATKRGILIGAGSVAALVATWWGYSYLFGQQPTDAGNI